MHNQAYVFLCTVLGGAVIAFIYDLFRIRRKAMKTSVVFIYIEDFVYWILVALVMFGTVFYSNDGELRGYIFLGSIIGVVLYILLLSKIVVNSAMQIIRIVCRILIAIWRVLTYPFRLIYRILRVPCRFVYKFIKKLFTRARHAARNKFDRHLNLKRAIRNIVKKK